MWWPVLLAAILAAGVRAFAPTPIRWGGISAKRFVLAPSISPSGNIVSPKSVAAPQRLTIWSQELSSTVASNEVPYFVPQPDKTIAWHGTGLCIEASGDKSGNMVSINRCSGNPKQLWNLVPVGRGYKNQIQLKGTNECIDVHGREGELDGAPVELQRCDDTSTEAWEFEASFPLPTGSATHRPSRSYSMLNVVIPLASMGVLGVLSVAAWLWRGLKQSRALDGGVITDGGGVSLAAQLATLQKDSPSIPLADERMVPAVMVVDTDDAVVEEGMSVPVRKLEMTLPRPSVLRRSRRWLAKRSGWNRITWRLKLLTKSKRDHDAEEQATAELALRVAELSDAIDAKDAQKHHLRNLLVQQSEEAASIRAELETKLARKEEQYSELSIQNNLLETTLESDKKEFEAAKEQIVVYESDKKEFEAAKEQIVVYESEIEGLRSKLESAKADSKQSEEMFIAKTAQLEGQLEEQTSTVEALVAEKTEIEGMKSDMEASLKALAAEKADLEARWGRIPSWIKALLGENDEVATTPNPEQAPNEEVELAEEPRAADVPTEDNTTVEEESAQDSKLASEPQAAQTATEEVEPAEEPTAAELTNDGKSATEEGSLEESTPVAEPLTVKSEEMAKVGEPPQAADAPKEDTISTQVSDSAGQEVARQEGTTSVAMVLSPVLVDADHGDVFLREVPQPHGQQTPQVAACKSGSEILEQKRWAVVGRGTNDIVQRLLGHLAAHGREVQHIDPYQASGPDVPKSLLDLPAAAAVDVVNLCAKPSLGIKVVEDCKARGIHNIFIQPGASSKDIEESCAESNIFCYGGCVLAEMC